MFTDIISTSPLIGGVDVEAVFHQIVGDSYCDDVSFVSTLRALVAPRINGDELSVRFYSTNYSARILRSIPAENAVMSFSQRDWLLSRGIIYIHSFNALEQVDNYANLELFNTTFLKVYKDWVRLEKVTDFFRKRFKVLCFINPELKSVVLFVDKLNMRRMHYLQCAIFAFLPWYFNPEEGVSDIERELIQSLTDDTSAKYEETIAKIAAQYDFRAERIKRELAGFETKFERLECERVKEGISNTIVRIEDLNEKIGSELSRKSSLELRLLGLETKLAQADGNEESEIMEYFLCNKKLSLYSISETTMIFIVRDYLTYFDEDMAKSIIDNNSSYVYLSDYVFHSQISDNEIKLLMNAIFVEQMLKIRFCAAYRFDLHGSVEALSNFDFGSEIRECMPNPHINNYHCLGTYEPIINNLLIDGNYIGVIEQCVASCKSLNFSDSIVMRDFMAYLYGLATDSYDRKYIETADGLILSPKEAIQWLKDGGVNNE